MKTVSWLLLTAILLLFSVSCDNSVSVPSGGDLSISEPSVIIDSSGEKSISAAIKEISYEYKMTPTWTVNKDNPAYGNTGDNFIELTSFSNLGYFSQGIWDFTLKAYTGTGSKKTPLYEYSTKVEVNSKGKRINIDSEKIKYLSGDGVTCSLNLNDFKVFIPDDSSKYGETKDYLVSVIVIPLESNKTGIAKTVIPVSENNGISFEENLDYGVINNFNIGSVNIGAYEVILTLSEKKGENWVKTGGTAVSISAIPGATLDLSGSLAPNDYVPIEGDGSIIIDSGKDADITITASVGTKTITPFDSVNATDTVVFNATVKNNDKVVNITSGQWFVNGNLRNTGNTFSYKPEGMAGKTVTITYMILDDTYNTISENYYLTVNA